MSCHTEKAGIGKGTAYDYFESKEELIACALVFYIRKSVEEITETLSKKMSFTEQIELILDEIEQKNQNQQWFFHFVHIMTDNNEISRIVRDKIMEDKENGLSRNIFGEMIRENKKQEVPKRCVGALSRCSMFSRFMTYMISVYMEDFFSDRQAGNAVSGLSGNYGRIWVIVKPCRQKVRKYCVGACSCSSLSSLFDIRRSAARKRCETAFSSGKAELLRYGERNRNK